MFYDLILFLGKNDQAAKAGNETNYWRIWDKNWGIWENKSRIRGDYKRKISFNALVIFILFIISLKLITWIKTRIILEKKH